jgi:rhombotail lipoprotein
MTLPRLLLCCFCSALASCGATSAFRFGLSDLQEELDSQPPLFTDADIAELEALAPQLPDPFRLGIAPPLGLELDGSYDWCRPLRVRPELLPPRKEAARYATFGAWDAEEAAVIEEWGRRFREAGIVSEVVLLPRFLVQGNPTDKPESFLPSLRRAAARHHVDAVLVVNRLSASQSHMTLLSVLDLTLVGAYIVPSYEVSSMTVVEAALVDTRNGYLYASARGDGCAERYRPAMQIDRGFDEGEARARVEALEDLGQDLFAQVSRVPVPGPAR